MPPAAVNSNTRSPVVLAIGVILLVYIGATLTGWTAPGHTEAVHHGEGAAVHVAHIWAVLPFALLLSAIAVLPLHDRAAHWWEHNLNKFFVAGGLALITLVYLAVLHPDASFARAVHSLEHVMLADYIPFIILLFSLYTISGGIRIEGDLPAHPLTNATMIASGGLLASFVGTTGAAMLLIRVLLETNSERKHVAHTVVFFIFIACNCGGLLLPLGDPPLFLGYLHGVDFLWTLSMWKSWLFVNGMLLAVYLAVDHFFYYPHETKADIAIDESHVRKLQFSGVWPNSLLLVGVILSVALLDSSKPLPGTSWYPYLYLREAAQLALVAASLVFGARAVRKANKFDYLPIVEVAVLFVGIFMAMQPALEILNARGADLGIDTPLKFFWGTGWLSSVLDNAPTYLVFFEAARIISDGAPQTVAGVATPLLTAISLGAVTMGAMTYIGNGPNFMVKAIAEKSGVRMPSFFGYMGYSFAILLPILVISTWLFLD